MKYCIHSEYLTEHERLVLIEQGYRTVALPKSVSLTCAVCDHPDLSLFLLDGCAFTTEEHADYLKERIPSLPLHIIKTDRQGSYPSDAALCVLTVGKRAFYNKECIPDTVLYALRARDYSLHEVKQGYAACTVLALDGAHAVTADVGMARALERAGIEVLTIENSDILLPPYPYGFIGGACGVVGNTVYTMGNLATHRCGREILAFIERIGMRTVSLSGGLLRDRGRLLFFEDDL